MSKWTEIRDSLVAALDVTDVAEAAKNQLTSDLIADGMPAIEAIADKFVTEVQAQADSESGWNAIRDKLVIPLLVNGTIWITKLVLSKSNPTPEAKE